MEHFKLQLDGSTCMMCVATGLHDQFTSRHSVLLSMFFGPLGLLSHLITQVSTEHFTVVHLPYHAVLAIHGRSACVMQSAVAAG